MTRKQNQEATQIMCQMDLRLQEYALDMLRHLKTAQDILKEKDQPKQTA